MEIYTAVKYLRVNLHTGSVKQGKAMGLHTGCQLCQPVRMFPSVGQGQTSQHLLCTQAICMEHLWEGRKHNGMDVVKACQLTSWQETKLCHFAVLKNISLGATAVEKETAKPMRSMKFRVHR